MGCLLEFHYTPLLNLGVLEMQILDKTLLAIRLGQVICFLPLPFLLTKVYALLKAGVYLW